MRPHHASSGWRTVLLVALAFAMAASVGGCAIVGFSGAMIDSYRRHSTRTVEAEYHGLEGKQWAVVVTANRIIQADHPQVVPFLNARITERLLEQQELIGATGFVPAENVLSFIYENPRWIAMPRGELARSLGVERLIFVELLEYRLNDPGNQYLWDGLATGTVGVIEADSPMADEYTFERAIRVSFPDQSAMGPGDMSTQMVATVLAMRFVDRATWLFYKHEEPYYPKY
jgi:hypothetical protein